MRIIFGPVLFFISLLNFTIFSVTGYQSVTSYRIFRKTYVYTNGLFNDFISRILNLFKSKISSSDIETLNSIEKNLMSESNLFFDSMKKSGYYIFKSKINTNYLNELIDDLASMPIYSIKEEKIYTNTEVKDLPEGKLSRQKKDLLNSNKVLRFALSKEIILFAQLYLGVKPICNNIASWITKPLANKDDIQLDKAAQKFHFDMDKIKFIKFFIYLTDVDSKSGPHIYVESSHKKLPSKFKADGRFNDNTISTFFQKKSIIEITGKKGTLIAVDTRGLHKGKPLSNSFRDIIQVEFCNSLFGRKYNSHKLKKFQLSQLEQSIIQ